jgi:hypothetical protein
MAKAAESSRAERPQGPPIGRYRQHRRRQRTGRSVSLMSVTSAPSRGSDADLVHDLGPPTLGLVALRLVPPLAEARVTRRNQPCCDPARLPVGRTREPRVSCVWRGRRRTRHGQIRGLRTVRLRHPATCRSQGGGTRDACSSSNSVVSGTRVQTLAFTPESQSARSAGRRRGGGPGGWGGAPGGCPALQLERAASQIPMHRHTVPHSKAKLNQ